MDTWRGRPNFVANPQFLTAVLPPLKVIMPILGEAAAMQPLYLDSSKGFKFFFGDVYYFADILSLGGTPL